MVRRHGLGYLRRQLFNDAAHCPHLIGIAFRVRARRAGIVRFPAVVNALLSDTQPSILRSTLQDVADAPNPNRIEDYAIIGNCESAALVGRDGSIDWLGLPRFDSPACFAALLGGPQHGRWLIAPTTAATRITRRYRGHTLILETAFETPDGAVCVIDFMSRRDQVSDLVRLSKGSRARSRCAPSSSYVLTMARWCLGFRVSRTGG